MEPSEARGIEEGSSVGRLGELSGCAIGRSGPGMWRVLGTAGWLMLEFEESFFNVARHGHVGSARFVIPLEGHAKEAFARPFCGDVIQGFESGDKVFGVFAANIFDAKVVDNKAEGDRAGGMMEEARSVFGRTVAKGGKMFDKAVVCKDSSLREAVHAFANLDHDIAVVDEGFEVVLVHDAVGNGR